MIRSNLLFLALFLVILASSFFTQASDAENPPEAPQSFAIHDKPLIERYVFDELKSLRYDQQDLERRLTIDITDRELAVADKSMNYANVTVTYFFYMIAGVASLVAFIGWQSLREIKTHTAKLAANQLQSIAEQYEEKFKLLEQELKHKSRTITDNNREIEVINEIHNLWLRAQSAQTRTKN